MTVSTNDTTERYEINGAGPYAFSFRIFNDTDLTVVALSTDEPPEVVPLTYLTHYTVTGANESDGGSITLTTAAYTPYDGYTVDIRSNTPEDQPTSIRNQARFLPEIHEDAFDYLSRQIQDLNRRYDRTVRFSDDTLTSGEMAPIQSWLSKYLAIGPTGLLEAAELTSSGALTSTIVRSVLADSGYRYVIHPVETSIGLVTADLTFGYDPGDVRRYGAELDGVTSDHAAFQLADSQSAAGGAPIFVPRSEDGMATAAALTVDYRSDLIFEPGAFVVYTGAANIVVLTIGGDITAETAFSRRYENLWVTRTNQSDWTSENSVGIRMQNIAGSYIGIADINSHTIGLQAMPADSGGFQGNQIHLGHIYGCKYAIDVSSVTNGFANDNTWYGGRIQLFSGTNDTLSRFGIRVTSSDATYTSNNGNRFYGTLIELNAAGASGEAVAVWVNHGEDNRWLDIRSEGNDLMLRTSNAATRNVVEAGYSDSTTTFLEQLGTSTENVAIGMRLRPRNFFTMELARFDDMGRLARGVSGTSVLIPGLMWGTSGSATRTNVSNTNVTYDGNYLTVPASRGVGFYVNTASCKEFIVRRSGTAGGRVHITPYDAADGGGSILTGAGHVFGAPSSVLTEDGASFGGSWSTGSDTVNDVYIRVGSSVLSVFILVAGGSASAVLSSFSVYIKPTDGGVRAFTGAYTSLGEITGGAYTTGAHATLRDFTGTTTAAQALQLVETLVDDLKTLRILR